MPGPPRRRSGVGRGTAAVAFGAPRPCAEGARAARPRGPARLVRNRGMPKPRISMNRALDACNSVDARVLRGGAEEQPVLCGLQEKMVRERTHSGHGR